ncbi:hypothetical protein BLTE_29070 [Blastochloris tepida]|uniref:Glycine zipper domain-containing protein n=2 Tax=Blastochloris tepida TaxID=2233851 RepID=A0A348G3T9_9HYPH|nr:hypothetical protein BLTE_29070 [Blastochloris tepida]
MKKILVASAIALALGGCSQYSSRDRAVAGGLIGAGTGAAIGAAATGTGGGALAGGAIGAVAGAAIGAATTPERCYWSRRYQRTICYRN